MPMWRVSPSSRRAWIEITRSAAADVCGGSPSSRRAWIEIPLSIVVFMIFRSPSSRRAWIEIQVANLPSFGQLVALLAEGVDRNYFLDEKHQSKE